MNYSGNMPDWHQYNPQQPAGTEVTSVNQNVNANHLFNSSIAPRVLSGLNLSSDGLNKSQNDANYSSGTFQPSPITLNGPNGSENSLLSPMVQMSSCVGAYGTFAPRNPMIETLHLGSNPLDPRNRSTGALNETIAHRNSQMALNGTMTHMSRPNMNINGALGSRSARMNSIPPNRQGSYIPCKGPCCNPDMNACYQNWDKFGSYPSNVPYRDNIGLAGYSTDNGQFRSDFNFRKDSFENKETLGPSPITIDPCKNFPDYKYRKDSMISRNYAPPSGLLQSYPMQNYNFTGDYQKYPYAIKDYPKENGISSQTPAILKYQEQSVIVQQKYTTKQIQYQNSGTLEKGMVNPTVGSNVPRAQNPYFNSQFTRDFPRDFSRNNADSKLGSNRIPTLTPMHGTYPKYQMYQQKIAMQRFSMENHLRELTSIPGYQSHPKYQEYVLRYKELLRLQQTIEYQSTQEVPQVISTPVNDEIPPINLQFNQHGVLINSSCVPGGFSALQNLANPAPDSENVQQNTNTVGTGSQSLQCSEQFMGCLQTEESLPLHQETFQEDPNRFPIQKDRDQEQFQDRPYKEKAFDILNPDDEEVTIINHNNSKDFADKPELDVRQFLATWDESGEEEEVEREEKKEHELGDNLQDVVLNDSASVVIVEYKNTSIDEKGSENFESFEQKNDCYNKEDLGEDQSDVESVSLKTIQNCSIETQVASDCNVQHLESDSNASDMVQHFEEKDCSGIHCDTDDTDNLPTIQAVNNLENKTMITEIQDEYQNLNSSDATVSPEIPVVPVSESVEEKQPVSLFENNEHFQAKSIIYETDSDEKDEIESPIDLSETITVLKKENCTATNSSSSCKKLLEVNQNTEVSTNACEATDLSMSPRNNLEHMENSNLQKQNSFMSEESHNPDDISLPDLPTSECTPFSTTLNTPIYSDSEESSEHVEDLTISTNPIEIIQNSPMLSFTHSPIKIEPYEHLDDGRFVQKRSHDSLDFDFQDDEHCKKNKSTNAYESQSEDTRRHFESVNCTSKNESTELSNAIEQRDETSKNIQLFSSRRNTSSVTENKTDINSDVWLPLTSAKSELQSSVKEERNKFRKDVEDSETNKQLIDTLQTSTNVNNTKNENLSMSTIKTTEYNIESNNYSTKMTNEKFEEKVNVVKNLELDSKINKDINDVYDLRFTSKVNKLLKCSSEMTFIHSNHEVCCSLVETNVFPASEDHEKLYASSDHNKAYTSRILDQPNFSNNSSIIPLIPGEDFEEPKMPVPPMEGNCLTKIMKNTSPITDLDVLGSDDEKLDKMDNIWMEVDCTDKTLDTNLNIEPEQNSFQEKNLHSKKLLKVRKSGLKHSKESCTDIKKSIKKILKANKSKSNLNSNNELDVKIRSESTLITNPAVFNNDSESTIIDELSNTVEIFQEDSTKNVDVSKKLIAQKSTSNNEDDKCAVAFRESSKVQELIKVKGNHINDIATKLLENARTFEPEPKRTEDSRSTVETSKERIKLLKEFRKSRNKLNSDGVKVETKISKSSTREVQDNERDTVKSNVEKIEQQCAEIEVLTDSHQTVNELLHCNTKEKTKCLRNQDNNKMTSHKDSDLIEEEKISNLKDVLLTSCSGSLEEDTVITLDNHFNCIEESKHDDAPSVESNLRNNTDNNLEINLINSNQNTENGTTWNETLSIKDKSQDNIGGLDNLFKIESNVSRIESSCTLKEESFNEEDAAIEESNISVFPRLTKCFPCSMEHCTSVARECTEENITNVSAKLHTHSNNNNINSNLVPLTFEEHNKCDEFSTHPQPGLTNITNDTDKCTNGYDDRKEKIIRNSLNKLWDDVKRRNERDIEMQDDCYLVSNEEKKESMSTYLVTELQKVSNNTKCSLDYLEKEQDISHKDSIQLPNKQEKEDMPPVIQETASLSINVSEKGLRDCLAAPVSARQLLDNNKQIVPIETIKLSKKIKSPKATENSHDKNFNEIDLNLSSATNNNTETSNLASSSYFDFDNFDVAPNEDNEADIQMENWKYSKTTFRFEDCEKYKNPDSYVNPFFTSLDALENLNTVPTYTTKDGKITYSPNPKFTYRALILEARQREGYPTLRDFYHVEPNSHDYYDNSKWHKSRKTKYNVTDRDKKRYTECNNQNVYESSPKHLSHLKYKDNIGSGGYYRTADKTKFDSQYYNGEPSKKCNVENIKQENIYASCKKPIEKFQYRGKKHYRTADKDKLTSSRSYLMRNTTISLDDNKELFDITQLRNRENAYYDYKKVKTVLTDPARVSNKSSRRWDVMTDSIKRYSENVNSESCQVENITTLTGKTELFNIPCKNNESNNDKILNKLELEIVPVKSSDMFAEEIMEDETCQRVSKQCDLVIKPSITSCWREDRETNNFALDSKKNMKMMDDNLESLFEQTEITDHKISENIKSDKRTMSKSPVLKTLDTGFEQTREDVMQMEDGHHLPSGKSEINSKSIRTKDILKSNFEQAKNNTMIYVEQSFVPRKDILESVTSKKEIETILKEPKNSVKIIVDNQFLFEEINSQSTVETEKEAMFKSMENNVEDIKKEQGFVIDQCQVLKTTVQNRISDIASDQMESEINEAKDDNLVSYEQEIRQQKEKIDEEKDDTFMKSTTKDLMEGKSKPVICDPGIRNVLSEERVAEGNSFTEIEDNIKSIGNKLPENQDETDSTIENEIFKLSRKDILEDKCIKINNVSNIVFKEECNESNTYKLKNSEVVKEFKLDGINEDFETINLSNVNENNINNQVESAFLEKEIPKTTEEIKLDPNNTKFEIMNALNANEDNITDRAKSFIQKTEVSVMKTTSCNYENAYFEGDLLLSCQQQEHQNQKLERTNTFEIVSPALEEQEEDPVSLNSYVLEKNHSSVKSDIDKYFKDDKSLNVSEKMTTLDSIPKKEVSRSSSQFQHENYTAYSPLKDSDDNGKTIPKIIIKKTDSGSKLCSKPSLSFTESRLDSVEGKIESNSKHSCHPKIPRMIIRNAGSRPRTPVIEEVPEDPTSPKEEHEFFKVEIKLDEKQYNNEPDKSTKETELSDSRIPKMKIKLEDKLPKMIIEETSMESFENSIGLRKAIPKMKIKKVRCALPKLMDELSPKTTINMDMEVNPTFDTKEANMKMEASDVDCGTENINESRITNTEGKKEKISKLKIRRQNLKFVTPELSRKKHSLNLSEMRSKEVKKSSKESSKCMKSTIVETTRYLKMAEQEINTLQSTSGKVPKVIIKRTSSNAEFKCELSKDRKDMIIKTKKWQPKVKLQRSWVLDCMAKMGDAEFALKLLTPETSNEVSTRCKPGPKRSRWRRIVSNQNCQRNILRSDSTLSLIPVRRKQRSESDHDFKRFVDSGTFSVLEKLIARKSNKENVIRKIWCENFNKIEELKRIQPENYGIINTILSQFNQSIRFSYLLGPTLLNEYYKKIYIKFLRNDFNCNFNRVILRNALESSTTDFNNIRLLNVKILEEGMTIKRPLKNSKFEHTFLNENDKESDNSVSNLNSEIIKVRKRKEKSIKSDLCAIDFENVASESKIINFVASMPVENECNKNSRSYSMYIQPSKVMYVTSKKGQVCTTLVQYRSDVSSKNFEEQDHNLNAIIRRDIISSTQRVNHLCTNYNISVIKDKAECKGSIVDDCIGKILSDRNTKDYVKKSVTAGEELLSETIKYESISDGKALTSDISAVSNSFGDNDISVIKVDSSDESQTTIEILPASPDFIQNEIEIRRSYGNCDNDQLYPEDAIPTQFELELEIVDNNNVTDSLDVPVPDMDGSNHYISNYIDSRLHGKIDDKVRQESNDNVTLVSEFNTIDDKNSSLSSNYQLSKSRFNHVEFSKNDVKQLCSWETNLKSNEGDSNTKKSLCCSELLVKEVLAAKEALRKCLKKSKNESRLKFRKRPKTAAEKKQGSSFDLGSLMNSSEACFKLDNGDDNSKYDPDTYERSVFIANNQCKTEFKTNTERSEKRHSKQDRSYCVRKKIKLTPLKNEESVEHDIHTEEQFFPAYGLPNVKDAAILAKGGTMVSLRDSKRLIQSGLNNANKSTSEIADLKDIIYKTKLEESELQNTSEKSLLKVVTSRLKVESLHQKEKYTDLLEVSMQKSEDKAIKNTIQKSGTKWLCKELKSYKIPKISRSKDLQVDATEDSSKEIGEKEDKMPVLEPEVDLNYKPNSNRETSLSPPVITSQEVNGAFLQSPMDFESKIDTSNCRVSDKEIEVTKQESDITVADIVNKLAYHEKATIKHRRYCILCERWFPTVARHRRHLTGYQHRHTELTQRRTVHALFMLFTGRPCPRLQSTDVIRTDYLLGEPTPLQIAVQDIAKGLDETNGSRNQSEQFK